VPRRQISRWLVVVGLTLWVALLGGVAWLASRGGCDPGPCTVHDPAPSFYRAVVVPGPSVQWRDVVPARTPAHGDGAKSTKWTGPGQSRRHQNALVEAAETLV
jgi:hypothetical protein